MPITGLSVQGGRLFANGQRFRNIGVNWGGAVVRIYSQNPSGCNFTPASEQDAFITWCQSAGVKAVRFKLLPFYPNQWRDGFQNGKAWNVANASDRALYWAYVDSFLVKLKAAGIFGIPTVFFRWPTLPDMMGEGCRQWLNAGSNTRTYATTVLQEAVTRYSPGGARADLAEAIGAWEYSNEVNHVNDCNATNVATPGAQSMWTPQTNYGTAASYSRANDCLLTGGTYDFSELRTLLSWFDGVVSAIDSTRLRLSGNGPNAYWQPGGTSGITNPLDRWADEANRDNPTNSVCMHVYRGIGYGSFNGRGASTYLTAARTTAQRNGKAFVIGEYGNQPRSITSLTVSNGVATMSVGANWASEVGDVMRVVGSGGFDGDYVITALPGGQNSAATLRAPAGAPNGSSSTGVVQHNVSLFERETNSMIEAQVDLAMVWCYESDPLIQTGQSVTHACNAWQTSAIAAANSQLANATW